MLFIKFFLMFSVFIMHQTLASEENNTLYFEYKLNELIVKKNKSKQKIDTIIEALNSKPSDKTSEEFLHGTNENKMKINNKLKQIFSILSEELLKIKFPIIT